MSVKLMILRIGWLQIIS